jgi:hypothetical protein
MGHFLLLPIYILVEKYLSRRASLERYYQEDLMGEACSRYGRDE